MRRLLLALAALSAAFDPAQGDVALVTSANPRVVHVGQSVNLTCELKIDSAKNYGVLWYFNEKPVAENCAPYDKERFDIHCDKANHSISRVFTLTIREIKWNHRGQWLCGYASIRQSVEFNITMPGSAEAFLVTRTSIVPGRVGNGSRQWPIDLTGVSAGGLNFTCLSSCGFPPPQPRLQFTGVNVLLKPGSAGAFPIETASSACGDVAQGLLRSTRLSASFPNCSRLGLDGLTRFTCSVGDHVKELFVRCPVIEREYPLTQGEIAAASVGCVLGLLLLALGFCIFCRCKSSGRPAGDPAEEPMQQAGQPMEEAADPSVFYVT